MIISLIRQKPWILFMGSVVIGKPPYSRMGDYFCLCLLESFMPFYMQLKNRKIAGNRILCSPFRPESVDFSKFLVGIVLSAVLILFFICLGFLLVGKIMDFLEVD